MQYTPKPIETQAVAITGSLSKLTERLAENAHEVWAQQRMKDGWTWGPERDDLKKKHPCLVPYEELPENEKEYDRVAVLGVLRALLALGYKIEPGGGGGNQNQH